MLVEMLGIVSRTIAVRCEMLLGIVSRLLIGVLDLDAWDRFLFFSVHFELLLGIVSRWCLS